MDAHGLYFVRRFPRGIRSVACAHVRLSSICRVGLFFTGKHDIHGYVYNLFDQIKPYISIQYQWSNFLYNNVFLSLKIVLS